MALARWILVKGDEAAWWLLPDTDGGVEAAPGGPWHPRAPRLESPLLTRPLRLASAAPVSPEELPSADVTLVVAVRQVEAAPGPAALRASASDGEWHHALDELMEAMASVAEAGGFTPRALGVVEHRLQVALRLSHRGHGVQAADRLVLIAHGWCLLGLSRGLALEVALVAGEAEVRLAGGGGRVSDPIRVLIIEDDEQIAMLLQRFLRQSALHVDHEADGQRGVDRFLDAAVPYDVLLVDGLLPTRTGFSIAEAVRDAPRGGRVGLIMMSAAFKSGNSRREASAAGFDAFFAKPFVAADLVAAVIEVAERRAGKRPPAQAEIAAARAHIQRQSRERAAARRGRGASSVRRPSAAPSPSAVAEPAVDAGASLARPCCARPPGAERCRACTVVPHRHRARPAYGRRALHPA